jgi:succinate dehydrogenase assembly factor 2
MLFRRCWGSVTGIANARHYMTGTTTTTTTTPRLLKGRLGTTMSSIRSYRGLAQETPGVLSEKEQQLVAVAAPKAEAIRSQHVRLPNVQEIPTSSLDGNKQESNIDIRRKRLLYRSKQRGWLEVDLLLGTWAYTHVPTLSESELDEYETFVNMETIDIYNIITLRTDIPHDMKTTDGTSVVERIQTWARHSPLGQADPEKYKQVKTDHKLI